MYCVKPSFLIKMDEHHSSHLIEIDPVLLLGVGSAGVCKAATLKMFCMVYFNVFSILSGGNISQRALNTAQSFGCKLCMQQRVS